MHCSDQRSHVRKQDELGYRFQMEAKGRVSKDLREKSCEKSLADIASRKHLVIHKEEHLPSRSLYKDECWNLGRTSFLLSVLTWLGRNESGL